MVLEAEQLLRDAHTDKVYARMTSTAFGIGQGGYGGPRGPTRPSYPPPKRAPDALHVFKTSPEQTLLYRLCGDYNPIHADDNFAREGGFKEAFMQGLGTWNIAAHGVLKEIGSSDPSRFCSFKARFANIVYPSMSRCFFGSKQQIIRFADNLKVTFWRRGCGRLVQRMVWMRLFSRRLCSLTGELRCK